MKRRAALSLIVATAGVATLTNHHYPTKRPEVAPSAASVTVEPVPLVKRHPRPRRQGVPSSRSSRRVARPAGEHRLSDVTMYCATGNRNAAGRWPELGDVAVMDRSIRFGTRVLIDGNVYTVRDWIGSGSDFDIYGGSDAGCEQRALNFGRRHLQVVIER